MPTKIWATQARYTPGQVWRPKNVPATDVNPRPLNPRIPSNGLIGCFSGDEKWVFATAWEPYQELFQGVARCLHSDFRLGAPQPGGTAGTATYGETWPEDVAIRAEAMAPSIVVVRNAWAEGWSATVDGTPAPVLRTDYLLQGVPVPPGTHEVRLTYRDPAIGVGLWLSALVWMGWLGAALAASAVIHRRTRRAGTIP